MLITFLILVTLVVWVSIVGVHFRYDIWRWLDNRYGPKHRAQKPEKPPKRRMYD